MVRDQGKFDFVEGERAKQRARFYYAAGYTVEEIKEFALWKRSVTVWGKRRSVRTRKVAFNASLRRFDRTAKKELEADIKSEVEAMIVQEKSEPVWGIPGTRRRRGLRQQRVNIRNKRLAIEGRLRTEFRRRRAQVEEDSRKLLRSLSVARRREGDDVFEGDTE